jgi:hypothetical protein
VEFVEEVEDILDGLRSYWPLTLRQIYYQLVAALVIDNNDKEYRKLSSKLAQARLQGLIPWEAMEDRTRSTMHSAGWEEEADFIERETEKFLLGYRRDLLQSQEYAYELWVEKDALSSICHEVAFKYCIPVIVAKGFSSISYVHQCRKRIERNLEWGKKTRILYFGDLDPSGWFMLPAMLETLQDEMELGDAVEGIRGALTPEQVRKYSLPKDPKALKAKDPRAKKYVEMFGTLAVELDALSPPILQEVITETIEGTIDMDAFEEELEEQEEERVRLAELRTDILASIEERLDE